jgi:hypothetical protein
VLREGPSGACVSRGTVVAYGVAGGREPTQLGLLRLRRAAGARALVGFFVYATGEGDVRRRSRRARRPGRRRRLRVDPVGHARLGTKTRQALEDFGSAA